MLLGAALCSGLGLTAAILHMLAHSILKIALFFCAGALLCRTEEMSSGVQEYVFQYTGYARKTPSIFAVFTIASLGLIGIPPLCGFVQVGHRYGSGGQRDAPGHHRLRGSGYLSLFDRYVSFKSGQGSLLPTGRF